MHTTEEALKELEQILQRTRELSVDAANGTKTEEDTKNIAEEIKQLKEQAIKLGNTRHAGRSVFTGFKTDKDLLQSNGTYNIKLNKGDISNYNVGISEDIDVNVVGSRVFGFVSNKDLLDHNLKGLEVDADTSAEAVKRRVDNLTVIKDKLKQIKSSGGLPTLDIDAITSYGSLPTDVSQIKEIKKSLGIKTQASEPQSPPDPSDPWPDRFQDEVWFEILNEHGDLSASENDGSSMMKMFDDLIVAMEKGDHEQVNQYLTDIDREHGNIVSIKAEIGAKTNRLDMTEKRLSSEKLNFKTNLSKNEDVDYAELIMKSNIAETVYKASLSISARIIQPSLMDFLR